MIPGRQAGEHISSREKRVKMRVFIDSYRNFFQQVLDHSPADPQKTTEGYILDEQEYEEKSASLFSLKLILWFLCAVIGIFIAAGAVLNYQDFFSGSSGNSSLFLFIIALGMAYYGAQGVYTEIKAFRKGEFFEPGRLIVSEWPVPCEKESSAIFTCQFKQPLEVLSVHGNLQAVRAWRDVMAVMSTGDVRRVGGTEITAESSVSPSQVSKQEKEVRAAFTLDISREMMANASSKMVSNDWSCWGFQVSIETMQHGEKKSTFILNY